MEKPSFFGINYANAFKDSSAANAHLFRPPYPAETFQILLNLISDRPCNVLDIGCGTGNIARNIAGYVRQVDAVDFSASMIDMGKSLSNGKHPNLGWILGRMEDVVLCPPYAMVTAGQSLHWMEWDIVFVRFREILSPDGFLVVLDAEDDDSLPWKDELQTIIKKYSTNPTCEPYDMIAAWERNSLFRKYGEKKTAPIIFVQSIEDYLKSFHSMSSLSRGTIGNDNADKFDNEVRLLVSNFSKKGQIQMRVSSSILWGKPM